MAKKMNLLQFKEYVKTLNIRNLVIKMDLRDSTGEPLFDEGSLENPSSNVCCCFHPDAKPSLSFCDDDDNDRHFFNCFGCGVSGDVITFVQQLLGYDFVEALGYLADLCDVELTKSLGYTPKPKIDKNVIENQWKQYLADFARLKPEIAKYATDMFSPLTIGYVASEDYFALPYTNKNNEIVGFTKRRNDFFSVRDTPKWLHSTTKDSNIGLVNSMFNLGRAFTQTKGKDGKLVSPIKQTGFVFVVEGPKDVIGFIRAGFENCVAISGCSNVKAYDTLRNSDINYILCYDGDSAGKKGMVDGLIHLMENEVPTTKIKWIELDDGKDPYDAQAQTPDRFMECIKHPKEPFELIDVSDMNSLHRAYKAATNNLFNEERLLSYAGNKLGVSKDGAKSYITSQKGEVKKSGPTLEKSIVNALEKGDEETVNRYLSLDYLITGEKTEVPVTAPVEIPQNEVPQYIVEQDVSQEILPTQNMVEETPQTQYVVEQEFVEDGDDIYF